jgi:putative ABC transport system permease protein
VVVNQALAEDLFPEKDPIGRRLSVNFIMAEVREYEIVGVAGDMRITAVSRSPEYQMYFGYGEIHPIPSNSRAMMVRTQGDMASLVPAIRQKVRERDPDAPLTEVSSMKDVVSASLTGNRVLGLATALFAVTALLLSMTGLYAVLAYYVSRRTREIGIRVAFGATGVHVMRSVLGRGFVLVVIGLGVGFASAFGVTRLLQAQLYQVGTTDPLTFVSVGLGLLVIGALASILPARRATRVDPVRAMQVE